MTDRNAVIGEAVGRLEDDALIRGEGRFLDDIRIAGTLSAAFVRSPYAHAKFNAIDADAAFEVPGVIAIFTMESLRKYLRMERLVVGMPSSSFLLNIDRPVLADGEVCYVGEPIAIVVAENRYAAEDAAELIDVDFEPLPGISDCREAFAADAARVHEKLDHNMIAAFDFKYGEVEKTFEQAPHRYREKFWVHRGGSHSMEGRGVLAVPDLVEDKLTVWSSTQTPHSCKRLLCDILGLGADQVRVVAPDLGGAFGPKLVFYQEEAVVSLAARLLSRPVKWVEDRREHFISTAQERDQYWDAEIAADNEGNILGVRGALVHDYGAYTVRGVNIPYGAATAVTLAYNIPAYEMDVFVALTNKVPVSSVRGAGQPQGVFVMERLMDGMARKLAMDRAEIRRKNIVRADQFPHKKPLQLRGGRNVILDSGDYLAVQEKVLQAAGWQEFPKRQAAARKQGRYLGMGLANYVEGTGRGPFESVSVRIDHDGRVRVASGAAAMGQSTQTMLAQIVAEHLGVDIELIEVTVGDTAAIAQGIGGFNSRQTVMAGASAYAAALEVRKQTLMVAAELYSLDARLLDIRTDSVVSVETGQALGTLAEVAQAVEGIAGYHLPGSKPGLTATEHVIIDDMCFSNGSAVVEVEVDIETGEVKVLNVWLVHDCGRIINPKLVDGQVMGGIAHGLGNALFEWMGFDGSAQPITTTFADYLLMGAAEMPALNIYHQESPSPLNALGVKGVGESGVLPIAAAVASAIDDALKHLDVPAVNCAPISPVMLREQILGAREQSTQQPANETPEWRTEAEQLLKNYREEEV